MLLVPASWVKLRVKGEVAGQGVAAQATRANNSAAVASPSEKARCVGSECRSLPSAVLGLRSIWSDHECCAELRSVRSRAGFEFVIGVVCRRGVMDKTIREYASFGEMKADEYRYWQSRPVHERLSAVSKLSQEQYGMKGVTDVPRLERTLVRVERARR